MFSIKLSLCWNKISWILKTISGTFKWQLKIAEYHIYYNTMQYNHIYTVYSYALLWVGLTHKIPQITNLRFFDKTKQAETLWESETTYSQNTIVLFSSVFFHIFTACSALYNLEPTLKFTLCFKMMDPCFAASSYIIVYLIAENAFIRLHFMELLATYYTWSGLEFESKAS